jgi:hypothetical protein
MLVWLSFADPHRPEGETFIGVIVVQIPDDFENDPQEAVEAAMDKANALGILPEMHGCISLTGAGMKDAAIDPVFWHRLLSKGEITSNDIGVHVKTTIH